MAKYKRDILEEIILGLEEEKDLEQIKIKFEERFENSDDGFTVSKDYVRKVVKSLEEDGKINTDKEIKKNFLKLKVIPK